MLWTCILSWVVWSFNINYSSPWTWYIFSSVCVIFNFFHQYSIVLGNMSFTSLCRFIPRHFILFHMIKNGIFLVFLSDGILLVYRKIIGFYISTLYPEPFLNPLMRSSSFLLTSLGFSHLVSHHLQTVTVSLLSLQFGVLLFFSFPCLITVVRTFNVM